MAEKASGWDQTRPVGNGLGPSPQHGSVMVEPACHTVFCTSAAQGSYTWKPLLWVKGVDRH